MAEMRAKMKVNAVNRTEYGEELKMSPVCKTGIYGEDGLDEDNTFAKFTPSGEMTLLINNPALFGKFNPGDRYYLDFTKIESPVSV